MPRDLEVGFYTPRRDVVRRGYRTLSALGKASAVAGGAIMGEVGRRLYSRGTKRSASAAQVARQLFKSNKKARTVRKELRKVQKKNTKSKKIEKRIEKLEECCDQSTATLISRQIIYSYQSSSFNLTNHTDYFNADRTIIESFLANPRVWNSETGVYDTVNFASDTESTDFKLSHYGKLSLKNNFSRGCHVTVYILRPKVDTSIAPATAFANGLTDVGGPSSTSVNVYLTDSPNLMGLFKIVKTYKKMLHPGASFEVSHSSKGKYNNSLVDQHSSTYTKSLGTFIFHVVVQGCVGHDTTVTTEIGPGNAAVDVALKRVIKMEYDGGKDFHTVVVTDNGTTTYTNNSVCMERPIPQGETFARS